MHSSYLQLTARDRANLDVLSRDDEDLESAKDGRLADHKASKRQRLYGKARARTLERQIAEGPNEILAALNLWHGFRLANKDPFHPRRARRLQRVLGSWGRSFLGTPALLRPLVSALEVMGDIITSAGLHTNVAALVADQQGVLTMQANEAAAQVNTAMRTILGPYRIKGQPQPRSLISGAGDAPEVDYATWQRAFMRVCVQSPGILEAMVIWGNHRAAMSLLAGLSGAPPAWRGRVYRCGGPTCRAPYQIWRAQPGAGRPPKRGAKTATSTRICRACRERSLGGNSRVKHVKARRRIPA